MKSGNYKTKTNFDTTNHIEGTIVINSINYSALDIINAFHEQGIILNQKGSQIRIGQKIIVPNLSAKIDDSGNNLNLEVLQSLTGQIQRIFSELNKLKEHIGINNSLFENIPESEESIFSIPKFANVEKGNNELNNDKKWSNFSSDKVTNPNYGFQAVLNETDSFPKQKDVPIIALGMKNKGNGLTNNSNQSLIDEFKDLTSHQGISDDEALDNLSTKIFKTANEYLTDNKSELHNVLQPDVQDKSDSVKESTENSFSQRCDKCNMKIQQQAKFCSKCGNKSN